MCGQAIFHPTGNPLFMYRAAIIVQMQREPITQNMEFINYPTKSASHQQEAHNLSSNTFL